MFGSIPWKIVSAGAGLLCVFLFICLLTANAQKAGLRKSLEREVNAHAKTVSDLAKCRTNVTTLEESGKRQAAAVADLSKAGQDATKAANAAVRAAEKASRAYRTSADRIAHAKPGADLCESARLLLSNTLKEERR